MTKGVRLEKELEKEIIHFECNCLGTQKTKVDKHNVPYCAYFSMKDVVGVKCDYLAGVALDNEVYMCLYGLKESKERAPLVEVIKYKPNIKKVREVQE